MTNTMFKLVVDERTRYISRRDAAELELFHVLREKTWKHISLHDPNGILIREFNRTQEVRHSVKSCQTAQV